MSKTPNYPTQSVAWETVKATEKWCKVYTPAKLNAAWDHAHHVLATLSDKQTDKFVAAWKSRVENGNPIQRDLVRALKPLVSGKPLAFTMFVYLVMPEGHQVQKQALYTCYKQITGKGSDTRLAYAVGWYLNLGIQTTAMPEATVVTPPSVNAPTMPGASPDSHAPLPDALLKKGSCPAPAPCADAEEDDTLDNTRAICDLMDTVAALKEEVAALKAAQTAPLDLTGVKEQMMAELREDLATGFDALAAEQQPVAANGSADPFAVLDEVKRRLARLGFKGTLTLTIE